MSYLHDKFATGTATLIPIANHLKKKMFSMKTNLLTCEEATDIRKHVSALIQSKEGCPVRSVHIRDSSIPEVISNRVGIISSFVYEGETRVRGEYPRKINLVKLQENVSLSGFKMNRGDDDLIVIIALDDIKFMIFQNGISRDNIIMREGDVYIGFGLDIKNIQADYIKYYLYYLIPFCKEEQPLSQSPTE